MKRILLVIATALGLWVVQGLCLGQSRAVVVAVNDARPLFAAASALEGISGIPVNYEDVRCDFPGDQKDITAGNVTPAQEQLALQNGFGPIKLTVPRGGSLTATLAVDASSGRLFDSIATANAWNEILLAYTASGTLPGRFSLEIYGGSLFLGPTEMRDVTGATVAISPVLSTQITLSVAQRNAFETLNLILAQVSEASGFKIGVGMVPMNALAMTQVAIDAVQEPASHVLARFMNSLLGSEPLVPASSPKLAYRVLYDPQLKYYMFNVVEVASSNVGLATPERAKPAATPTPVGWFTRDKP